VTAATRRPLGLRLLNRVGALRTAGLPLVRLDEASLLAEASRRTGLEDFGDDGFRDPLRRRAGSHASCQTKDRGVAGTGRLRTPTGAHYTRALVASVRHLRGIEACSEERRRAEGWLTCEEAAVLLHVNPKRSSEGERLITSDYALSSIRRKGPCPSYLHFR